MSKGASSDSAFAREVATELLGTLSGAKRVQSFLPHQTRETSEPFLPAGWSIIHPDEILDESLNLTFDLRHVDGRIVQVRGDLRGVSSDSNALIEAAASRPAGVAELIALDIVEHLETLATATSDVFVVR